MTRYGTNFWRNKITCFEKWFFLLIPLELINQVPQKRHKEVGFLSLEGHVQIIDFWSIKMFISSQISTTTTKTVFVRCPPPAYWDLGPSWVKRGETDRVYVIPKLLRLVGWSLGSLLWHVPPVSRPAYPDLCGLCRHNVGFHIFSLHWVWNGFASQPRILTFSPVPCPKRY